MPVVSLSIDDKTFEALLAQARDLQARLPTPPRRYTKEERAKLCALYGDALAAEIVADNTELAGAKNTGVRKLREGRGLTYMVSGILKAAVAQGVRLTPELVAPKLAGSKFPAPDAMLDPKSKATKAFLSDEAERGGSTYSKELVRRAKLEERRATAAKFDARIAALGR